MRTILCDIDGVLADESHRNHLIPEWDEYFARCADDAPIEPMLTLVKRLRAPAAGVRLVLVTGRNAKVRSKTEAWLDTYGVVWDQLYMRPEDSRIPAAQLKRVALEAEREEGHNIWLAIDDDESVCRMYRENGVAVLRAEK